MNENVVKLDFHSLSIIFITDVTRAYGREVRKAKWIFNWCSSEQIHSTLPVFLCLRCLKESEFHFDGENNFNGEKWKSAKACLSLLI